jgi:hypothetical protein
MAKDQERSLLLRHAENHPAMHVAYRTKKRLGDAVEAAFLARAAGLFFQVAKPWGEDVRYDFLVDAGRGIWRVQVKAATSFDGRRYNVRAGGASTLYTPDEIDFLAAHIVGENTWYVIPVEAVVPRTGLHLYPQEGSKGQFEIYREGWCLMLCPREARGKDNVPVHCRYPKLPVRCAVCPCWK